AGDYQPAARAAAGKGGGVDPELLTAVADVGEVCRLRALGYRHIVALEWSKRAGLTDRHLAQEQLDFYAAHGDWLIEVGDGLSDARLDADSLLRRVDKGRVDAGMQARGVGEVQHAADRGDDDQHPDRRRHRYPVPQGHDASRRT